MYEQGDVNVDLLSPTLSRLAPNVARYVLALELHLWFCSLTLSSSSNPTPQLWL